MSRQSYAQSQIPDSKHAVPYPDWRQFIQGVLLRGAEAASGTVVGTGALLDVPTPFDPAAVILIDETQGVLALKMPGQATDTALTQKNAVTTAAAAGSITLGSGKFTIGVNADLNTAADVIRWTAFGFSAQGGQ